MAQKCKKKTITFHILQNTSLKKALCCNPRLDQKLVFLNLHFLEKKNIDVEQKENSKSGESKDKERGFERKRREETNKTEKESMNKNFVIAHLTLFLSWNKAKNKQKERKSQNKKPKESKKDKEGRKKENKIREIEREREKKKRKWKRGRPKKAKQKHRETLKNRQNNALFRGKYRIFLSKTKKGDKKNKKDKENKQKTNKEGLGPSEVGNLFLKKNICVTKRPFLDQQKPKSTNSS